GGVGDVCVFDLGHRGPVVPGALRSQGRHTPFAGHDVPGRVRYTLVAGQIAYEAPPVDA
ncbi:MAG: dihydroorotase, partial [Pseudomonadota bacterium]|nr:dihydroorotase [Pseudomonadota bacterium]